MAQDARLDDPAAGVGNKGGTPVLFPAGPPPAGLPPSIHLGSLEPAGPLTPDAIEAEIERLRSNYTKYQYLLLLILGWVAIGVVVMALIRINVAPSRGDVWQDPGYSGRWGYTLSLAFVLVPVAFLLDWYRRKRTDTVNHPDLKDLMQAVWSKIAVTAPTWITLDILLANRFFTFPDERARVLPLIPGFAWSGSCDSIWSMWRITSCYPRTIPLEEVIFYVGGGVSLALLYMWAAEDFFRFNTMPKEIYEYQAKRVSRLVHWNKWLIWSAIGLAAAGVVIKKFGPLWEIHHQPDGWPLYFFAQIIIVFVPLAALYDRVRLFTNPQAFLFVMVLSLLVDLIWESTLAIPYGWWGYRPHDMMGSMVTSWSNLPIEAIILWLAIGWTSMFMYEAGKIKVRSGKTWPRLLLGRDAWLSRP